MKTGSLAASAADRSTEWRATQLQQTHQFEQSLLQELNTQLATVTADTLQLEIEKQSHLIAVRNKKVIVCLHLNKGSIMSRLKPLLENSPEFNRLQALAKNEGFINLSAISCESATKIGFDLLLMFQLPN